MYKHSKQISKKRIFTSFLFFTSIILFILSTYLIVSWLIEDISSKKTLNNILNSTSITETSDSNNTQLVNPPLTTDNDYWDFIKTPLINVDFNNLLKINKDTVAWITVNNTNINYPVVQASNNNYYLKTSFDGSSNRAGWIFADYRNNMNSFDKNTIIYGHNRLNEIMFGSLKNILQSNWYTNKYNHIIRLSTPTQNTMWQVFSVYKIKPETYYISTTFSTDEEYNKFLNVINSRSIYDFNVHLSTLDKILTLSTCSNTRDSGRIVLHAKLIKQEFK